MLDKELIRITAARSGLGMKFISKENRISNLLSQISNWKNMEMALKGGTAINRIHLRDNARFSEDIDIDVFGSLNVDEKLALLNDRMGSIHDFTVEGPRMMRLTARYDAFYINEFGEKDRVMIDLYLANNEPHAINDIEEQLISSNLIQTHPSLFPAYSLEDLIAQKLIALAYRLEGKDLYDLYFTTALDHDTDMVLGALKKRLELRNYQEDISTFLGSLIDRSSQFKDKWVMIMNGTNHFIPRSKRPDWRLLINTLFDRLNSSYIR